MGELVKNMALILEDSSKIFSLRQRRREIEA